MILRNSSQSRTCFARKWEKPGTGKRPSDATPSPDPEKTTRALNHCRTHPRRTYDIHSERDTSQSQLPWRTCIKRASVQGLARPVIHPPDEPSTIRSIEKG
ncbi:hypothetical protein NW759_001245 [Fusarium solani]|nr:hypothetical protein NW759_001245 [Fusarium solani]